MQPRDNESIRANYKIMCTLHESNEKREGIEQCKCSFKRMPTPANQASSVIRRWRLCNKPTSCQSLQSRGGAMIQSKRGRD